LVLFRFLSIALALIEDGKFVSVYGYTTHVGMKLFCFDLSSRTCFAVVL